MAVPRTDPVPSPLPKGAPPPNNWQQTQTTTYRTPTISGLQSEYGGSSPVGVPLQFDPKLLAVWGIDPERAVLPVLWGRGGTQLAGGEARNLTEDVPHAYRLNTVADETKDYLTSLQSFYAFGSDQLAQVQTAMWGLGLLPSNWNTGLLGNSNDKDSIAAWKDVVQIAMQSEKTIWEVLQGGLSKQALAGRAGGGRGGGARPKQPIRLTSAQDLKEAARQTALDTIGYVPDEKFLGDFVKLYHGLEAGSQRKHYAGGTYQDPGSPQVRAQEELRDEFETEAGAFSTVKAFDAFLKIIGAGEQM